MADSINFQVSRLRRTDHIDYAAIEGDVFHGALSPLGGVAVSAETVGLMATGLPSMLARIDTILNSGVANNATNGYVLEEDKPTNWFGQPVPPYRAASSGHMTDPVTGSTVRVTHRLHDPEMNARRELQVLVDAPGTPDRPYQSFSLTLKTGATSESGMPTTVDAGLYTHETGQMVGRPDLNTISRAAEVAIRTLVGASRPITAIHQGAALPSPSIDPKMPAASLMVTHRAGDTMVFSPTGPTSVEGYGRYIPSGTTMPKVLDSGSSTIPRP